MDSSVESVLARLRGTRAPAWLEIIDAAELDRPAEPEPDPERVVGPYLELLTQVGAGVQLTRAGYLPKTVVLDLLTALGWNDDWPGKNFREDLTRPILDLRESAQRLGLVRKYRGQLVPTKLGRKLVTDPAALWWHLAARLPVAPDKPEADAAIVYLLLIAAGRSYAEVMVAEGMTLLGWVFADGEPVTGESVHYATFDARAIFRRLNLYVEKSHWAAPDVPNDKGRRLARAALLGQDEPAALEMPHADRMIQLTVTLREVDPIIWRRLKVPDSLTLRQFHEVLQTAMGWQDYHLHLFDIDGVIYRNADEDFADLDDRPHGDETAVSIGSIAAAVADFRYDYDFGDGWEHDIHVEAITAATDPAIPVVLDGARACPPEDCGGPGGYADLLRVLADPGSNLYEHLVARVGVDFDPEAFDKSATNDLLGRQDRQTRHRPA